MQSKDQIKMEQALRALRHLYEQMLVPGMVKDQTSAAKFLLGPAIEILEKLKDSPDQE